MPAANEEFFTSPQDGANWYAAAGRLAGCIAPSMERLEYYAAIFKESVARRRVERLLANHEDCMELLQFAEVANGVA